MEENTKQVTKEELEQLKLWNEIERKAFKMADNPSFEYGVPYWAIADFIDNLKNKYAIYLREG